MNKCNMCQKSFSVASWNKKQKFCSHVCYWKSLEGRKLPVEQVRKMGLWKKEHPEKLKYWKGKKNPEHSKRMRGKTTWNKGIPMKESTKEKLRKSLKGLHNSPSTEWKKGMVGTWTGKKLSKEHIRKIVKTRLETGVCVGENHYNWQGGKSFEPYTPEFNGELKRFIRKRDKYRCVLCGKTEKQEKKDYGCVLAVDHKNGDKKDCSENNLRTLCKRCNSIEMQRRRKATKYNVK